MDETQPSGMQRLSFEIQTVKYLAVFRSGVTIDRIAEQRMTDRRHMDADLMSSPGLESAFDQ